MYLLIGRPTPSGDGAIRLRVIAGVQNIATTQTFLPGSGVMLAIIIRLHLLPTDGADLLLHHQAAVADAMCTVRINLQKDDFVNAFVPAVQKCPEVGVVIQLTVIAEFSEVLCGGGQNGMIGGDGDQLLDFHNEYLFRNIDLNGNPIFVLFVTRP